MASFNSLYLLITLNLGLFYHFDEIVWLQNSSMRLNSDDIHVFHLFVFEDFLCYDISGIHDAVFVVVGVVIKEDVLRSIVSLIKEQKLCDLSVSVVCCPVWIVILDRHSRELLERIEESLVDDQSIGGYLEVLVSWVFVQ